MHDAKLQAALLAVGHTENYPVVRPRHPIWESANRDMTGTAPGVLFVLIDTHSPKSCMGDLSLSLYKEFHEAVC